MNCREAQDQVFAERDGALESTQRAALDSHVATCATCRHIRENLEAAVSHWRAADAKVVVPDAEREWHAVRRKIRGGMAAGSETTVRPRRNFAPWFALPIGAVAAAAIAFYVAPGTPKSINPTPVKSHVASHVARADSVEAPGNNASTMVFVDDKSGWLIVWASDGKRG